MGEAMYNDEAGQLQLESVVKGQERGGGSALFDAVLPLQDDEHQLDERLFRIIRLLDR